MAQDHEYHKLIAYQERKFILDFDKFIEDTMKKEEQDQDFILWNETEDKQDINNQEDEDEYSSIYEDQNFRFNDLTVREQKSLIKCDPKNRHRAIHAGLNLKATCRNKECLKKVWIKKGYGKMILAQIRTGNVCPACAAPIPSKFFGNLGYRKAKVIFEGKKVIDDQDVPFNFQDIQNKGKFITFKDADEKICEWSYLNIDVQPL